MEAIAGVSAADVPLERRNTFIAGGAEMVRFLEAKGMQFVDAEWPDYHDEFPGGRA